MRKVSLIMSLRKINLYKDIEEKQNNVKASGYKSSRNSVYK